MKKFIATLLLCATLFSLFSCKADKQKGYDKNADLLAQADKINKNDLSADEIKDVEERAKMDGFEMYWKDDGKLVLDVSETMEYYDSWIDNRFTRLIEKPKDGYLAEIQVFGNSCSIMWNWTTENAIAYVEKYKKTYSKDVTEEDGRPIRYVYYGVDKNGVEFHVTASPASGMIKITLPEK